MRAKTKIHFVCRGNTFRSRLAEAYARSLMDDRWEISSSGITEDQESHRRLSPWATYIGRQNDFEDYFSTRSVQTTEHLLNEQDIIVFMKEDVFREAQARYKFTGAKSVIWSIKDRKDWAKGVGTKQIRQRTFKHMRRRIEQLIKDVEQGGWIDIVDEQNTPLGFSMPISIANQNGLWHRSCHALITTPSNATLVQKRSRRIVFAPGLLDISLGGHVDAGEEPDAAMFREIKEETGLTVDKLRLLEVYKLASYHPRYKRYSKYFIYSYHVPITEENPALTAQKSEVQQMKFLSRPQLIRLVRNHRLKGLGRLNYPYHFYIRKITLAGLGGKGNAQ